MRSHGFPLLPQLCRLCGEGPEDRWQLSWCHGAAGEADTTLSTESASQLQPVWVCLSCGTGVLSALGGLFQQLPLSAVSPGLWDGHAEAQTGSACLCPGN